MHRIRLAHPTVWVGLKGRQYRRVETRVAPARTLRRQFVWDAEKPIEPRVVIVLPRFVALTLQRTEPEA